MIVCALLFDMNSVDMCRAHLRVVGRYHACMQYCARMAQDGSFADDLVWHMAALVFHVTVHTVCSVVASDAVAFKYTFAVVARVLTSSIPGPGLQVYEGRPDSATQRTMFVGHAWGYHYEPLFPAHGLDVTAPALSTGHAPSADDGAGIMSSPVPPPPARMVAVSGATSSR